MKLSMIREISRRFAPPTTPEEYLNLREQLKQEGIEFQNFYQELEMSAPMAETHRDVSYSNANINLHSHNFYEMLFCQSSDGVEYLVGAERYRLKSGDIVIVAPGVSHRPLLPEMMTAPYKRDIIWFSKELVEQFPEMLPDSRLTLPGQDVVFLRTKGTKWDFLGEMFRSGVKEAERGKAECDGIILGNTIIILSQIARALHETSAVRMKAEKPELLDRVMAYIEDHLGEKITLEETASHFYVSVSTITQLFRQRMGTSFYHCVTQRRLIAAKARIGSGETLEDVSHAVGFADYSSFYRAFKKEYGITPRQYTKL
ncbi:MAG: AraC family transcriptional regulator [Oscillospiraceae bacterium]|nr:AraC family transcriptional regulator [Oscillospiraceae bacterium]